SEVSPQVTRPCFSITTSSAFGLFFTPSAIILDNLNPGRIYGTHTKRSPKISFAMSEPLSAHAMLIIESGCRSEEHTSELQSRFDLVCRLLLEKKNELSGQ